MATLKRFFKQHFYTTPHFYKSMLAITLPIALQNVISLGVNMMDIVMLGKLGDVAIAAANLGGQPFLILNIFGFGLSSGGAVLIAQYWGKRDTLRIRHLMGLSMRFALLASCLMTFLCASFPHQILSIFTTDPAVIAAGAQYLRYLSISFVFYSISSCYLMCLRAVENVKVSICIYFCSFFVNVFFNYCFIFGKFGFPEMGVAGAALGTVMARIFECGVVLVYMCFFEKATRFTPRWLFKLRSGLFHDYIRTSIPVVGNELLWGIGLSIINMTIGRMGTSFATASSISAVVSNLCSVFVAGMSNAAAVVIGKTIGEGRLKDAQRAANTSVLLCLGISLCTSLLLFALRSPILSLYDVSAESHALSMQLLTILSVMQPVQAIASVILVGILRGGGDVKTNFILDCGLMWVMAIPLGLLGAFVFEWSAPVVFFCMRSDNIVKSVLGLQRLRSGKWIRVVTQEVSSTV